LPKDAGILHFVNADLIANGLSPLRPELAAVASAVYDNSGGIPRLLEQRP